MEDFADGNNCNNGDEGLAARGHANDGPVFVLTASRSGSTLLRFILDSHPDLACPPETGIASACAGLARTWSVLGNAESGHSQPVTEPVSLPPHAILAVRTAIDQVFGDYLRRRGKRRWCDKSLDSYQLAGLITQVYPEARFICLFRHCMDVIASGVEVCPWGLHRFGFDPFVAQHPGNSVAAIGNYWVSCTQAIWEFADKYPGRCYRIRYEDLVTAPEETAAAIFSFLGVPPVPGIAGTCFQTAHEGGGPGDEKIWFTARINRDSMGRGVCVPAAALPPPLRQAINETLPRLGYRQVDDDWNASPHGTDPRAASAPDLAQRTSGGQAGADGTAAHRPAEAVAAVREIIAKIASRTEHELREIKTAWPSVAASTISLVVHSGEGEPERLRVNFAELGMPGWHANGSGEPTATMIASAATWRSVLAGQANIITEITGGRLRCVNKRDTHRIRSDEVHAVAALLGVAPVPTVRATPPVGEPSVAVTPGAPLML